MPSIMTHGGEKGESYWVASKQVLSDWSEIQVAYFPKITNEALFIAKIYEALVMATDFQIGSETLIVNGRLVRISSATGDYAVKVKFVKY